MATVEVLAPPGMSLTLTLFPLDSDTSAAAQAMTEATNRSGLYTATITGQSGNFHAHISGDIDGAGYVWLQDDSGTYRTTEEGDFLAYGEPGQEAPAVSQPLRTKLAYLFKGFRNRFSTDNNTGMYMLYGDDGTTVDQKGTATDAGGVANRGEMGSGP